MPYVKRQNKPALYYEITDHTDPWRDAPYLVLQHGYGRSTRFWYSWLPYLSRHYKILCPDMRGFGRSEARFDYASGFTFDEFIADIVAVVDEVGAQKVHYCGEAFGGTVGMQLAARHPERIRTLNLISAPVFLHQNVQQNYALGEASWIEALKKHGIRKWVEATNLISRFPPESDPAFREWYSAETAKNSVEVLAAFSSVCAQYDMSRFLPDIACPVLGIYPRSRPEQVELLAEHCRNFQVIQLPTDFFMIYNIHPATCATHVLHFALQHDGVPAVRDR